MSEFASKPTSNSYSYSGVPNIDTKLGSFESKLDSSESSSDEDNDGPRTVNKTVVEDNRSISLDILDSKGTGAPDSRRNSVPGDDDGKGGSSALRSRQGSGRTLAPPALVPLPLPAFVPVPLPVVVPMPVPGVGAQVQAERNSHSLASVAFFAATGGGMAGLPGAMMGGLIGWGLAELHHLTNPPQGVPVAMISVLTMHGAIGLAVNFSGPDSDPDFYRQFNAGLAGAAAVGSWGTHLMLRRA